jgi:acylglycerol lipase
MEHNEGFFKGLAGNNIYYQNWLPEGGMKASVIAVHGLAEHSGRYLNLVNHLVPSGYGVHSFDFEGHGKSDGMRGYIRRFRDYTDTLETYTQIITKQHGHLPLFLAGHSMGGLIALRFLLERQRDFTGAVLSGPLIRPKEHVPAIFATLVEILSIIFPKMRVHSLEAQYVSRDPEVVKAYIDDPLVFNGKITSRLGSELAKTMSLIATKAGEITLPLLIVQGGADKLVDPQGTQEFFGKVQSADKTIAVYDGLYHEVFNEPEKNEVLQVVKNWIDAHLPDGTSQNL